MLVFVGLFVALSIFWQWYSRGTDITDPYVLELRPIERLVAFSGTTVAQRSADLAFEVSGRVTDVTADTGDRVERGTILARVESGNVEASLARERAVLDAEEARLAALVRGTRPEALAVVQAEFDRANNAFKESERSLSNANTSAYAAADTAIYKTADLLFSQPQTLPRLLYESSDSSVKPSLESERQDTELLLSTWRADVRSTTSALTPATLTLALKMVASAATAEYSLILDTAVRSRTNLATIINFFDHLIDYAHDLIPGGSLSQTAIDDYVSILTKERTALLAEISSLSSAIKSYTDAKRAAALASASLSLSRAGASTEEIAEARALVAAQKARVAELQSSLEKYLVRAPFTGTIVSRSIEPGELGTMGQSIFSVDGDGTVEIEARVSELDIISLQLNDVADVTLDAYQDRTPVRARIIHIDPAETIENGIGGYGVTLAFDVAPNAVRPGMTVNVLIVKRERDAALAVPQQYIRRDGARAFVQLVSDERIEEREVSTGISIPGLLVELLSGVAPGNTLSPYELR